MGPEMQAMQQLWGSAAVQTLALALPSTGVLDAWVAIVAWAIVFACGFGVIAQARLERREAI